MKHLSTHKVPLSNWFHTLSQAIISLTVHVRGLFGYLYRHRHYYGNPKNWPKIWRRQKLSRKIIAIAMVINIVVLPIVSIQISTAKRANAWWNDDWGNRTKITINNPGSSLTNYQVAITLDTASLITAGKLQSDCDDIRIFSLSATQVPYYLESCNSTASKIWVKFTSLSAGNTSLWIYYGNPAATSVAVPGDQIFTFFDDFTGASLDTNKWTNGYSSSYFSLSNGVLTLWSDGTNYKSLSIKSSAYTSSPTNLDMIEVKSKNAAVSNMHFMWNETNNRFAIHPYISGKTGPEAQYRVSGGSYTTTSQYATTSTNTYYIHQIARQSATAFKATTFNTSYTSLGNTTQTQAGWSGITFAWSFTDNLNIQTTLDWVRIRKYAASEPTTTVATEEKGPTPALYWSMDSQIPAVITNAEQQINLVNQEYIRTSNSAGPTDNSLGLVHWDADKYSGATVYFEADIYVNNNWSGQQYAYASLYTSGGTLVSNSTLSTTNTSYTRLRSAALTLTDDTDYTIRTYANYYGMQPTVYLKAARLIIIQSNLTKLAATESQVELGAVEKQTNTAATQLSNPKIYRYDATKFSPPPTTYLEASVKGEQPTIEQQINILNQTYVRSSSSYGPTDNSLGIIHWDASKYPGATVYFEVTMKNDFATCDLISYASLYTASGTLVSGSTVSTCSSSFVRIRSGAITLTDNTDYSVRIYGAYYGPWGQATATIKSAKLIAIQTNATKITATENQVELGNNETSTATTYVPLTNSKIYYYDSAKFTPTPTAYFEATLANATSSATTYAALSTDAACTSQVSSSEISSTGTTWSRVRSSSVTLSTDNNYYVCLKTSADTARITNAKLILDQSESGGITKTELVHQQINTLATDADATYTSQNFPLRFNSNLESAQISFAGGTFAYYFEADLKAVAGTGSTQLYNTTSGTAITNSEISTTNTSYTRQRSSAITDNLPTFPTTIFAQTFDSQIKNSATNTTSVSNSWLIIQATLPTTAQYTYIDLYNLTDKTTVTDSQITISGSNGTWSRLRSNALNLTTGKDYVVRTWTDLSPMYLSAAKLILDQNDQTDGLKSLETVQDQVTSLATDMDSTYSSQSVYNYYNPNNFIYSTQTAYFEAVIKTSAGTGYTQTSLAGSEITTTDTSYSRVRSPAITIPSAAATLDTQIKNSASSGNTTSVASSRLIIQLTGDAQTVDSGPNQLHGHPANATWNDPTHCIADKCFYLNGTSSSISRPYSLMLDPGTSSFTFSSWFKHAQTISGTQYLAGRYSGAGWKIYMNGNGNMCFGIDDDSTWNPDDAVCSPMTFNDSKWHYLSAVKNSTSNITLSIDGQVTGNDSSLTAVSSLSGNTPTLYTGIDTDGVSNSWSGWIDEVKYFPYARTQAQITASFSASSLAADASVTVSSTQTRLSDNLVTYFPMDETSSPSTDRSGNGNSATWQGDSSSAAGKFGRAINLDGTNDYLATTTNNSLPYNWHHVAWTDRQPITVTNTSGSPLYDFQIKMSLNTQSLISASKLQSNCADLRFTDSFGNLLAYWISEDPDFTCNDTDTQIWIKLPTVNVGDTLLYMYYNNPQAAAATNGKNTFVFFDDFSTSDAKWLSTGASGSYSYETYSGRQVIKIDGPSSNNNAYKVVYNQAISLDTGLRTESLSFAGADNGSGLASATSLATGYTSGWYGGNLYGSGWSLFGVVYNSITTYSQSFAGVWYRLLNAITTTSVNSAFYNSSTQINSQTKTGLTVPTTLYPLLEAYDIARYDYYFIRKYAATEPTISFGTEQTAVSTIPAQMTLSVWVNPDTFDGNQRIIAERSSSSITDWLIALSATESGKIYYSSDNEAHAKTSTHTLSANTWSHIALVVNGLKTQLYINGSLDSEITTTGVLPASGKITLGGNADGTNGFDGKLDEFRVYNRSFSAGDVYQLYSWSPSLSAWWKLDENKGTLASDSSANGNLSSIFTTNTTWTSGKYGAALRFDGEDDVVKIPETATTDLGYSADSYTLNAWIKTAANYSTTATIVAKDNGSGIFPFSLYLDSSEHACFTLSDGTNNPTVCNSVALNDNNFHYISGIRDVGTDKLSLFVDGILANEITDTTTATTTNNADISLGNAGTDYQATDWNGLIDEVKLYNYPRNNQEINADMLSGANPNGAVLSPALFYANFDEGYGTTAHNLGTAVSANATITDGTWFSNGKSGNALSFTTSTSVVATIPDPGVQNTLALWLYPTTSIANKTLITTGKLTTNTAGQPVYGSCVGTSLPLNQWTHLVAVSNGITGCQLFQNGMQSAIGTTGVTFGTTVNLGNASFTGRMDEVKIYTVALDSYQAKVDMNQGSSMTVGTTSTAPSVAALWKFDENTGTAVNDVSTNNHHGIWHGTGNHWTNGKVGAAGRFNGTNDYVSVVDTVSSIKSVSFWIKPAAATTNILSLTGSAAITAASGTLTTAGFTDPTVYVNGVIASTLTANAWQFITITTNTPITASLITLGKVGSNYFAGLLDQVSFSDSVVSPAQIIQEYNQGAPIAWYQFDECQNSTAYNSAVDSNGNAAGLNGTISAGAGGTNTSVGTCISGSTSEMWANGASGKRSSSLQFDGTDDLISITDTPSLRFDANTQDFSIFSWVKRKEASTPYADPNSGGTTTTSGGYYIHTFTTNGSFTVANTQNVEVLVVAGGGGGGGGQTDWGGSGGGGGGGLIYDSNFSVAAGTYTVTVGTGGAGGVGGSARGSNGNNSTFSTLTAIGGGGGGSTVDGTQENGANGGSGGGGGSSGAGTGGNGTTGQGNAGGTSYNTSPYIGGGGGGAGAAGASGGNGTGKGGNGVSYSISGTSVYYAGGGAGGRGGTAGTGGGGADYGGSGTANTGGGGGGCSNTGATTGGTGGSGIIIIRYPIQYETVIIPQEQYLVSKEDADNDGYRLLINADNTVTCSLNGIDITSVGTVADANWHHVGCTFDRDGSGLVYIDGMSSGAAVSLNSSTLSTTANVTFGTRAYTPTSYFLGQLDDVQLFNFILSPDQVKTSMNGGVVNFQ